MGPWGSKTQPPPPPVQKEEFRRIWSKTTEIKWTPGAAKELRTSILKTRHTRGGKTVKPKILIFGPTGCGKSSLCNGFASAVDQEKYVSSYFAVGSTAGTFTKGFHAKQFKDSWIIDMGGIFETRSIKDENITRIATGKVAFYQEINDLLEVKDKEIVPKPGKFDVACVVIVLTLEMELPEEITRMLRCIMDLAGKGALSYHLVLTHPDICDDKFKDPANLTGILDSKAVQDGVIHLAEQTGIPPTAISVVRNYSNETETDPYSSLLFLRALDRIVHAAAQQFQKKEDMENLRQMEDDDD